MADIAISFIGRFWIYLISNIASIICSIFTLYHFLFNRRLRDSLHNHVIIILLIINIIAEITDIPLLLYLYRNGVVWIFTPFFCQMWKFLDSITYVTTARLVAWASIERHILIFHDNWMTTRKKKVFLHYLPIYGIITYGIIVFVIISFFLSCDRPYYPTLPYCGFFSCAYDSVIYSMFEFITGGIANGTIIAVFSLTLILRLIKQKQRVNQQINWRKHRKMAIQLLFITLLFYVFYLPSVIVGIVYACGVPWNYLENFAAYGQFFTYYINFFLPFMCAGSLPHLRNKIEATLKFCSWNVRVSVAPTQNTGRIGT